MLVFATLLDRLFVVLVIKVVSITSEMLSYHFTSIISLVTDWPARESLRSLNIALDFYVRRSVRLAHSAV